MKVFISWSGAKSKYIAEKLKNWIEEILQATDPWISGDIEKGKRWSIEIAEKLKESKVGIICLTDDNLDSEWINFEAGAISNTPNAYVCTFLYGIDSRDVVGPLTAFQDTKFVKEDVFKLVTNINNIVGEFDGRSLNQAKLESVFEKNWRYLEEELKKTPPSSDKKLPARSHEDLLQEILEIVRSLKNNTSFTSEMVSLNQTPVITNDMLEELRRKFGK